MLNVEDTLSQIPQMSIPQLDDLAELVAADETLDDDEREQIYDAIDEEIENQQEEEDDEDDLEIDIDEDEDDEDE